MKRVVLLWSASKLYKRRSKIQYPDFQREPTVWSERKKQLLIDSMLIGLDIPKLYLYSPAEDDLTIEQIENDPDRTYDCVDGQQRIVAVTEFFDGVLHLIDGRYWSELTDAERNSLLNYEFTIALITEASVTENNEDELRLLFLRLQLGAPLNVGEKLHALTGGMKNFVFDVGANHPFFQKVSIPARRYSKETVFAQICINSFYRAHRGTFYSARYEELKVFFEQNADMAKFEEDRVRVLSTLDSLDQHFGSDTFGFRNRAVIVSVYLFFEELITTGKTDLLPLFKQFYLKFLDRLSDESAKGLDYDPKYRELLDFETHILQAAVGRSSIEARHKILAKYFQYYLQTKEIKTTD